MRAALFVLGALLPAALVACSRPQDRNYYVLPISIRHGVIRQRGLLEAGKVDVDGSVHIGYFYASLALGTPPQHFDVIIDTGSTVTYVPCSGCSHCGSHADAPFDPSASHTSRWVKCDEPACKAQPSVYNCGRVSSSSSSSSSDSSASPGQCTYAISYAEQSSSEGRLVTDVFSFPNSNATKVPVTFGCVDSETGEIFRQRPDGLVGMGNSRGAFHSQLAAAGAIPHIFSLCFGFPTGGAMLLGDAPLPPPTPAFSWVPLQPSGWSDFYAVKMTSISFGGAALPVPRQAFDSGYGTVLDSGTTFIYLAGAAYTQFAAVVKSVAKKKGLKEITDSYGDICWTGGPAPDFADLDSFFPPAALEFEGGVSLTLPPYRYLFQLGRRGGAGAAYCLAVFDNGRSGSLIGGVATRNVLVKYDLEKRRVGFAEMDCHKLGQVPAGQFSLHTQPPATDKPTPSAAATAAAVAAARAASASVVAAATAAAAAPPAASPPAGPKQQRVYAATQPAAADAAPVPAAADAGEAVTATVTDSQSDNLPDEPSAQQEEEAEEEIVKEIEVLQKAQEAYSEAYEEVETIFDKAAQKAKAIIEGAAAAQTPGSSSSSGSSSSAKEQQPAAAPAPDSQPQAAAAGAAAAGAAAAAATPAAATPAAATPAAATPAAATPAAATPAAATPAAATPAAATPAAATPAAAGTPAATVPAAAATPAAATSPAAGTVADAAATPAAAGATAPAAAQPAVTTATAEELQQQQQKEAPSATAAATTTATAATSSSPGAGEPLSTTAAVSESLLKPSGPDSSSGSGSSTAEQLQDGSSSGVSGSGGFSATNLHGGLKTLLDDPGSSVVTIVLFAVMGVLLLAGGGVVAVVLRRRQIKAAGFSQLSAADIDCELAGISRKPVTMSSNDRYDTRYDSVLDDDETSGFSAEGASRGGGSGSLGHHQSAKRLPAAAPAAAAGGSSSSSMVNGSSRTTRQFRGAIAIATVPEDESSSGGGGSSYEVDAFNSPGRDQQSPAADVGGGGSLSSGFQLRLGPPPGALSKIVSGIPAVFSLDDDHHHYDDQQQEQEQEEQGQEQLSQQGGAAAAAVSTGGIATAAGSAAAAGDAAAAGCGRDGEVQRELIGQPSMEMISLD